jgi:hypothetical protein
MRQKLRYTALLLPLLSLSACSSEASADDIVGKYTFDEGHGTMSMEFKADGTAPVIAGGDVLNTWEWKKTAPGKLSLKSPKSKDVTCDYESTESSLTTKNCSDPTLNLVYTKVPK